MTRNSHSTQTEVSELSQDRHVKDFQPISYDYTGSPVNVTVPQGVQGVLFAAIGGSGGDTTTRGLRQHDAARLHRQRFGSER